MANQDTAFGLRPIGLNGASANTTGVTQYEIANDNTNAITSICGSLAAGVIDKLAHCGGTPRSWSLLGVIR